MTDLDQLQSLGFVVLRRFFEPAHLIAEVDHVLATGRRESAASWLGGAIRFQYVPMMTNETPHSLELLSRAEGVARSILGGSVLPTRAKGTRYRGDTPWHADSALPMVSLGFAAYLEPLVSDTGALRVLPGSHLPGVADGLRSEGVEGQPASARAAHTVETEPGDLLVFDEHLFHASAGGGVRRQWRVDFVRDLDDLASEELVRQYFAGIFPPDWDGGYDALRYPSYGPDWLASGRPSVERLRALGVYAMAARQEAFRGPMSP